MADAEGELNEEAPGTPSLTMQFKTKLGLVDIPNEHVLAAADSIRGENPTTAGVEAAPRSIEARFIDQDLFCAYVTEKVNPERAKEGLPTASDGVARHLYDVLTSGRYR